MWLKRPLSKLGPLEWGFLLGLVFPLTVYTVVLRSMRVLERGDVESILGWIDLYKSDALFFLAFGLIGLGVLGATRKRWTRIGTFASLQLFSIIALALETSTSFFYKATGSTLDFPIIYFFLSQVSETTDVVASETPDAALILIGVGAGVALVLPWGIAWLWSKFVSPWAGTPEKRRGNRWNGVKAAVGLALLFAAGLPTLQERSLTFARNSVLNIGVSFADTVLESSQSATLDRNDTSRAFLEPRNQDRKKNVVIVVMESTRASATGVHNPELETTPFLDEIAEESLVAERAHAVVPHTSKALVSILCGFEPRLNMPITEALPDSIPGRCMGRLFREAGYQTGFFQSATKRFEDREQLVENMGFEAFVPMEEMSKRGFQKANYFGYEDDIMLEPSRKWLRGLDREKPLFLTYLTLTPHHNYLAPRRYGRHEFDEDDELNRYLNSVHYVDAFARNVVEMFKEEGLYEDTIFVFVGDHGEGFDEHGRRQHDNVIWQEGLHIPLIIHAPGEHPEGQRVEEASTQLDILPTVTRMAGFDVAAARYPGQDLRELEPDRIVRAHCWYERRCMASIRGAEKYIHHFGTQPDEFYDLVKDPLEKNDLAHTRRDLDRLRTDLIGWRASVNGLYRSFSRNKVEKFIFDDMPDVAHELDGTFGSFARLVGYDVQPEGRVKPGSRVTVTYYWEVLSEIPKGWALFVHGEDHRSRLKNLDHVPVSGLFPVPDWKPDTFVQDTHTFQIPSNARGDYKIYVGLWHKDEGRAEVTGDIETDGEHRALAVEIPLERRANPRR